MRTINGARGSAKLAVVTLFAAVALAAPVRSHAAPVLSYDESTIAANAGSTIDVYATLTVDAPLITNGVGQTGIFNQTISAGEQGQLPLIGSSGYEFATHSTFLPSDSMANLALQAGQSVHLAIGELVLAPDLAPGDYSIDIGLYESCPPGACLMNPYMAPTFADAGTFSIDVAVPEPAGSVILALPVLAFAAFRRRGLV